MFDDINQVCSLVQDYFDGLHHADTEKLERIFDDNAWLCAPGVRRSKQQWLEQVASRPIPASAGYAYEYQLLSIELSAEKAMVKVFCPLLGQHYIDFLGLLKEQQQWKIVSKIYATTPAISSLQSDREKEKNNALC